jgi:hypothetical protein
MPSTREKKRLLGILKEAFAHHQALQAEQHGKEAQPVIGSRVFERAFYRELVESNGTILVDNAMICSRTNNTDLLCKKAAALGERYRAIGGTQIAIEEEKLNDLNAAIAMSGLKYRIVKS